MAWGKTTERRESNSCPLLISYEDDCKLDTALSEYDSTLKNMITNALDWGSGEGALGICGRSIIALSYSNKKTLEEISLFKANIGNKKGKSMSWRKMRKNKERINLLADQYINNSGELLEFVAEVESFQRNARDSCTLIKHGIQQYFQMKKDRETDLQYASGSSYYLRVLKILHNLKVYEPSTTALLARLHSLHEKQKVMLDNLTKQEHKLGKKQALTPWLRRAKNLIFLSTVTCMLVALMVTAALGAAPVAGVISFLPSIIGCGHWLGSCLAKLKDSTNYKKDLNDSMLDGTRVSNTELGNIKHLIQRVVNEINSLCFTPSSTINEDEIDSTMELIKENLQSFLTKIEELGKETEKFSKEILKARDEVYIRRDRLV